MQAVQIVPVFRVAWATDDLEALLRFYRDSLGMTELYRFDDRDGSDGLMLGCPGWPYRLEFTRPRGHPTGRAPNRGSLLVFYLPDKAAWSKAVEPMRVAGFDPVPSFNLYWDRDGRTFEDSDGYRVDLQNAAWAT